MTTAFSNQSPQGSPTGRHDWIRWGTIFMIASVVRIACGYIFLGSTDLMTSVENSALIMRGEWTELPYFPVIDTFIWFGGMLNAYTPLPLAFCYKIFPIVFDALTAVLIYDIALRRGSRRALFPGLLYALCPVPIIIVCLHGQWSPCALFLLLLAFHIREHYRDGACQSFAFGLSFGLSILVKPIGLIFLLIFFKRYSNASLKFHLRQYLIALAGLLVAMLLGLAILHLYEYPIWDLIQRILTYAGKGARIFGLPYAHPGLEYLLESNFPLMIIIAVFALLYYFRVAGVFTVMLLSYALIYTLTGLAPQYLVWIVAPLIITQSFRAAAVYTLIATAFLLLYYFIGFDPRDMNTYVALQGFERLMPSLYFAKAPWIKIGLLLGNVAIPLFCAILIVDIVISSLESMGTEGGGGRFPDTTGLRSFSPFRSGYIWIVGIIALTLSGMALVTDREKMLPVMLERIGGKISLYAVNAGDKFPLLGIDYVGNYPMTSTFNIITMLIGLAVIWSICSAFLVNTKRWSEA